LLRQFVQLGIPDIDEQISRYHQHINYVENQHIRNITGYQLAGDAADITEDNNQEEKEAFVINLRPPYMAARLMCRLFAMFVTTALGGAYWIPILRIYPCPTNYL
jgi:hypothetical protein